MVGDRSHDIEGARAHGIHAIGVTWGYGNAGELDAAGAVEICATVAELARALERDLAVGVPARVIRDRRALDGDHPTETHPTETHSTETHSTETHSS
jgi:hypothetical protein